MKPSKRARYGNAPKQSQLEAAEIAQLEEQLKSNGPGQQAEGPSFTNVKKFQELPLSQRTKSGLREHKYVRLTAIQRAALPYILVGKDLLGAAKTGSGKTLAFLLPVRLTGSGKTLASALGAQLVLQGCECRLSNTRS